MKESNIKVLTTLSDLEEAYENTRQDVMGEHFHYGVYIVDKAENNSKPTSHKPL